MCGGGGGVDGCIFFVVCGGRGVFLSYICAWRLLLYLFVYDVLFSCVYYFRIGCLISFSCLVSTYISQDTYPMDLAACLPREMDAQIGVDYFITSWWNTVYAYLE